MRALLGLFAVVLSLFTFFSTAHADVIDPGNPYRRPPRPPVKPIPVTRVYKMRAPDFTLTKIEEKDNTYLLQATLPGPCEWEYRVFAEKEGNTKEVARGGKFSVPELKKESDSREIVIQLPEGKEKADFLVNVAFTLYRFQETRYGPKVYDMDNRTQALEYVYVLETVEGKQILKKL
jgi:hypothetical protein